MLWIRRRLSRGDEGMSLVEMLIALFVLSVGLMALLGSFLTSARSLQHQEDRSQAQRATLEVNEYLRSLPFEDIESGSGTLTADGLTMTYVSVVTPEAVSLPDGKTVDVKRVDTTVTYTVRGVERTLTFTTTIAPDEGIVGLPDAASATPSPSASVDPDETVKAFVSFSFSPEPAVVDYNGNPTTTVSVTAVLTGYTAGDLVSVSWVDDTGSHLTTLSSTDGSTWSGTIARTSIKKVLASGATGTIDFTASMAADGLTTSKSLQIKAPVSNPPTVDKLVNSSGHNIRVDGTGRLTDAVTFTCTVSGLPLADGPHTVRLVYFEFSGVQKELAMSQVSPTSTSSWALTVPANSQVTFKVGVGQAFTCNATRQPDFGPGSLTEKWNVR